MEGALILVRHAMPVIEEGLPPNEWKLGENGEAQAQKFSQFLKNNFDLDRIIYTSNEPKALKTAEIIAKTCNCKIQSSNDLREIDKSLMKGEDYVNYTEEILEKVSQSAYGEESATEALIRFENGIKNVLEIGMEEERVVVTHGTVLALFLAKYNAEMKAFEYWEKLECPSYAVVDASTYKILEFNGRPLLN
ncbi:MAG: phosphoglycerate mutase family protein [Bacteriovoracaceae bacterium]|nr:phosphoglycerate mutase family protein [Bacteriovoracaceae bacterium]